MRPAFAHEVRGDARNVVEPDGQVEVVVLACYRAGMEIDGPAAEEPVLGADDIEGASNSIESLKLFIGDCTHACDSC